MQASTKFIIKNIEMLGFCNRNQDIIQSIIELLDNSIDACYQRFEKNPGGLIQIKINYIDENRKDLIKLDVIDNGNGFYDLENMLKCFISGTEDSKIGKYGIGLSSTLINSCLKANSSCKITTKLPNNLMILASEICFDKNSELTVKITNEINCLNVQSGTLISIILPTPNDAYFVVDEINKYITWSSLFSICKLAVDFEWATDISYSQRYFFQKKSLENDTENICEEITRNYKINNIGKRLKTIRKEKTSSNSIISLICQVYESNIQININEEEDTNESSKGIVVNFFRTVNGKPLIANQGSCEVYQTVATINKKEFYLKPHTTEGNSSEILNYSAILSCKGKKLNIIHPILCLFMNLEFEKDVKFGDLKKSFLKNLEEQYKKILIQVFSQIIIGLIEEKVIFPFYKSKEDEKHEEVRRLIPFLSEGLIKMIHFSSDPKVKEILSNLFTGEEISTSTPLAVNLTSKLTGKL